jgi:hypothetical protein
MLARENEAVKQAAREAQQRIAAAKLQLTMPSNLAMPSADQSLFALQHAPVPAVAPPMPAVPPPVNIPSNVIELDDDVDQHQAQ